MSTLRNVSHLQPFMNALGPHELARLARTSRATRAELQPRMQRTRNVARSAARQWAQRTRASTQAAPTNIVTDALTLLNVLSNGAEFNRVAAQLGWQRLDHITLQKEFGTYHVELARYWIPAVNDGYMVLVVLIGGEKVFIKIDIDPEVPVKFFQVPGIGVENQATRNKIDRLRRVVRNMMAQQ